MLSTYTCQDLLLINGKTAWLRNSPERLSDLLEGPTGPRLQMVHCLHGDPSEAPAT